VVLGDVVAAKAGGVRLAQQREALLVEAVERRPGRSRDVVEEADSIEAMSGGADQPAGTATTG